MRPPIPATLMLALALASSPAVALDLDTAWQMARDVDPAIVSARANRDAAQEGVSAAQGRLRPQISFQTTQQHLDQTTRRENASTDFEGHSRSSQVTLRQGIYRPRDWLGVDVATRQVEQGEARLTSVTSDTMARVAAAWTDAVVARSKAESHALALEPVTRWAQQESARLKSGEGTLDAVAEAQAQQASVKSRLAEARIEWRARLLALSVLVGAEVPPWAMPSLLAPWPREFFAEDQSTVAHRVLSLNPELASARALEGVAEKRASQALADHLPTLDLIGGYSRAKNDSTNTLGLRYENTQIGIQLAIPLYTGGTLGSQQRQAELGYVAASSDRDALTRRLQTQLSADWALQEGLGERIAGDWALVEAAKSQRQGAALGLAKGLRTQGDVARAQLQIATRTSDVLDLLAQRLKTQLRILSLLPSDDPLWAGWSATWQDAPLLAPQPR